MTLQIEEFQNDMIGCDQCKEPWKNKHSFL
jgi:hypothetical protein